MPTEKCSRFPEKRMKMKNYKNLIGLIIVVTLGLGLLGCNKKKNYSAQAPAVVSKSTRNPAKNSSDYRVEFSYTINGRTFSEINLQKTNYAAGTQGKACYIPSDPGKAYFALPNEPCGQ